MHLWLYACDSAAPSCVRALFANQLLVLLVRYLSVAVTSFQPLSLCSSLLFLLYSCPILSTSPPPVVCFAPRLSSCLYLLHWFLSCAHSVVLLLGAVPPPFCSSLPVVPPFSSLPCSRARRLWLFALAPHSRPLVLSESVPSVFFLRCPCSISRSIAAHRCALVIHPCRCSVFPFQLPAFPLSPWTHLSSAPPLPPACPFRVLSAPFLFALCSASPAAVPPLFLVPVLAPWVHSLLWPLSPVSSVFFVMCSRVTALCVVSVTAQGSTVKGPSVKSNVPT